MPTKRKTARSRKKVSVSSHIKSSLVYIAPHKHTGKKLAHHHTSHGILLLLLLIAGAILFFSLASLNAAGLTQSGNVSVTATVNGPAPSQGAVITTPSNKTKMKRPLARISGTCPSGTIAAIYNNGLFASSTSCSQTDTFQTTIQLNKGINTVQAQNYDNLNQPGPTTDQIEISFEPDLATESIPATINTPEDITIDPSIPTTPAPQPSENPCFNEPVTTTVTLGVWVPCMTRSVFVGERLELPVVLQGGIGPYALSIDWGDSGKSELFSFAKAGRYTLAHTYTIPQLKNISLKLADATGATYQSEALIDVSGGSAALTSSESSPFEVITDVASSTWLEASVPVYWAAVALFAGFWISDIFHRVYNRRRA